jgi:quercetin dioxygenase-like cupin family protein
VPIDIRRFGVGHRRPDGPPGTTGIEGQVIESGPTGVISELAFARQARIAPHTNPNWTWFVVIEGGGWVGVGEERTRIQAGEAAAWPPDVLHAAWTDGTQMRAIVVELTGPLLALPGVVDGSSGAAATLAAVPGRSSRPVTRGEGSLVERPGRPVRPLEPDGGEGEPL